MKRTLIFAGCLLMLFKIEVKAQSIVPKSSVTFQSPDKNLSVQFYQKADNAGKRTMYYQVAYKGKPFILESALDVRMDNQLSEKAMNLKVDTHADWCENLAITNISAPITKDTTWIPVSGENSTIRDHYNQVDISLVKDDNPIYLFGVQIRAYNEGVAIRYFLPENPRGTYYNITAENTEFALPAGTQAWFANWAQAAYTKLPLSNWPGESERPLTLELPNGLYATLAEAQMVDYARGKFKLGSKPNTIVTSMFGEAELVSPVYTPWRVIMVAEKPGDLIEHNYIMLNLNEPSKIANTSWIKPGKVMRAIQLNTAAAKSVIDFAAQQQLQYILFDFGWYGNGYSIKSDATKVIPELDMPGIIKYAGEKGIGVWLYVNQQALFLQSDSLYAKFKQWGVKGVKLGFVQVGSHRWTTWVEKNIQQAAENELMVDIHDEWRPTGEQRTWPNLMTAEGVRGNEEMPEATNNTILPFTRFIAGPADATFCYMDKRIKTTHAHQLALASIFFGPIQTMYWYDTPSQYHHEPELEYWDKLPTTFDETKVLQGAPGMYITTAKRKGNDWFVGTITNNDARTLKIDLSFLPKGKKYVASIYSDDPSVQTVTHVRIDHQKVNSTTVLTAKLLASGGQAVYITPEN